MSATAEQLEARIAELRSQVRAAVANGDRTAARQGRGELRRVEALWDEAVLGDGGADQAATVDDSPLVTVRDQVHRALTLLSVPAAPKLIGAVSEGFLGVAIGSGRLTSMRRDEERSFRSAPYARPYYLCPALTVDLLAPARGVLAVSSWPVALRMIGPLSPRVDLLGAVARLADQLPNHAGRPGAEAVLRRLARSVPGALDSGPDLDPAQVAAAARRELAVHRDEDAEQRERAARRVIAQLKDPADQLFGVRLGTLRRLEAK
ncbi:hypothetical protein [Nocardia stercoris]|uniref:Uncharacterized protein n=1 Tax=Nocardia stercoris TaxID=2483361 RepID=A0A3M2LD36_9NOCA|nr:hypothetical protein [Nocardia stercoris]RMI35392.1 hypothetical protein EBN03_03730 [Nocardia stercoris]